LAHLDLTLSIESGHMRVRQAWDDLVLLAGDLVGQVRESVAGAPCIRLDATVFEAHDDDGPLSLSVQSATTHGTPVQTLIAERDTHGRVVLTYLAVPAVDWPSTPNPPLELRRERDGFTGALTCFLVLPPDTDDATFALTWDPSSTGHDDPMAVSSLGESGSTPTSGMVGDLWRTYVICSTGPLAHYTTGDISVWWLTSPAFDVAEVTQQLGSAYQAMAATFDAERHPYRVFVRACPYRGMNASAHPASFVVALDPDAPADARTLQRTLTHELVHEWLHLDGPADETTWFNEGAADYYALVIAHRRNIIDVGTFASQVNTAARLGYANPFHGRTLHEAANHYWTDFRAHRLPYARGMFYLADLNARLQEADQGDGLDDLVRAMLRRQRRGEAVGLAKWCALVNERLGGDEHAEVRRMVFDPGGYPRPGAFGPVLTLGKTEVPIVDPGFHVDTFPTRQIHGLVTGGPADQAGLVEGEPAQMPTYEQAANLNVGEHLVVTVHRADRPTRINVGLGETTVVIPQWHPRA
jgi:hypothetical protein